MMPGNERFEDQEPGERRMRKREDNASVERLIRAIDRSGLEFGDGEDPRKAKAGSRRNFKRILLPWND
jgi:hypothetical protein